MIGSPSFFSKFHVLLARPPPRIVSPLRSFLVFGHSSPVSSSSSSPPLSLFGRHLLSPPPHYFFHGLKTYAPPEDRSAYLSPPVPGRCRCDGAMPDSDRGCARSKAAARPEIFCTRILRLKRLKTAQDGEEQRVIHLGSLKAAGPTSRAGCTSSGDAPLQSSSAGSARIAVIA